MKLLLDTHTLIWLIWGNTQLSDEALAAIQTPEHDKYVSIVTFWESAIKIGLGKLDLGRDWRQTLQNRLADDGIGIIEISTKHCEQVASLPNHHRDPFDRMLAAQSQCETLTLVSRDIVFDQYDVDRLW